MLTKRNCVLPLSFVLVIMCVSFSRDLPPKSHQVEIKGMQFTPAEIMVRPGDTIVWINNDMVVHDVTDEKKSWSSKPIAIGKSWKMVAKRSGGYYCSIHPVMKGKITLK
jgi:plastocyanin